MPLVLLHDYEYMVRKTFGLFASEMNIANVIETSEINQAKQKLSAQEFDLLILGFENWLDELNLIQDIRGNLTLNKNNIPIIALLSEATSAQIDTLKSLNVSEILLKPTRIKTIQKALENIALQ